jgi:hypothetical protein
LLKGDDDPMQVVIEVGPGKSSRGWTYTPQALEKLVAHVNEHTLSGIMGHQKEEDLPHEFRNPATHWIGAVWKDGKAYVRGVIDKTAPDLKRWIRSKRVTQPSIFTRPTLRKSGGVTDVYDLVPLSIDWAPLGRGGMDSARVAGLSSGEMDVIITPVAAAAEQPVPPTTMAPGIGLPVRKRSIGTYAERVGAEVRPRSTDDQPSTTRASGMEGVPCRRRSI